MRHKRTIGSTQIGKRFAKNGKIKLWYVWERREGVKSGGESERNRERRRKSELNLRVKFSFQIKFAISTSLLFNNKQWSEIGLILNFFLTATYVKHNE